MRALAFAAFFALASTTASARPPPLYVDAEEPAFDADGGVPGSPSPTLIKADGTKVATPAVEGQTGYQSVQFSADHRRAGWIVLKKLVCCSAALGIVVFKDDKIERVVDETCLRGWTFRKGGSQIAYHAETCHFSNGPFFVLLDVTTGKTLDTYSIEFIHDDTEWDGATLPADAPVWVRDVFAAR
jgi:hypothetical protein